MTNSQPTSTRALATYLALTFSLSAIFWYLVIAGKGQGYPLIFFLMWCPGVSAIVTRLIFQRNVRGQGWLPGRPRWLMLGYFLPVGYAGIAYAVVWLTGQGGVDLSRFTTPVFAFVLLLMAPTRGSTKRHCWMSLLRFLIHGA